MRVFFFAIAATVMLSVIGAAHWLIVDRLVLAPGWGAGLTTALTALIVALGVAIPVSLAAERLGKPPLSRIFVWPGAVWMGLLWLLLAFVGVSDLLLALGGAVADVEATQSLARGRALIVGGLSAALAAVGLRGGLAPPPLKRVVVEVAGWPEALDGFRFVQLSDLHVGPILGRRWLERLVARTNALEPDAVVITGDLVDGPTRHLRPEVSPLADLAPPHGSYFITGNHEMYSGPARWVDEVGRLGIRVLANERVTLGDGDDTFELAGTHDRQGGLHGHAEDLDAALAGWNGADPVVLLAHDPTTFRAASKRGVALQLSGHTHGGQIWPFGYLVRLAVPFLAGHYRVGDSQLYVSRGTGFWGPPMRLGAPAELTEITVLRTLAGLDG